MKVLQINSFFSVGGPPRIVQGIYGTLEANGHECVVAAGREKPYPGMKTIQIGSPINKYWHLMMSRVFDAQGLSSDLATKRFIKQIEAYDPDIIHLHNLHGYYLNIEILFSYLKAANKPVVWTLHDCWPFTGHCAHFDYIGCEKWKTGCYGCEEKKRYPVCNGIDGSKRNYQRKKDAFTSVKNLTIVTPSKWLGELVKESFLSNYPVVVINNGIDLNVFKPTESNFKQRYNIGGKKMVLGVAQVWGQRKGLKYFHALSRELGGDYQIVLVGLNNQENANLPSNIIGLPRTTNVQELIEIYTAANVFVNPTVEDNFPTTNLEALACGTPVVTFNTGGSIEAIDETCGVSVEKGDIKGLANRLKDISQWIQIPSSTCLKRSAMFEKTIKYNEYLRLYGAMSQNN